MKKLLFVLVIATCFSCKKEDATNARLDAETIANVSYGNGASQKMDVYLPAGRSTDSTRLIAMVHGGAWIEGDKSDFASFVSVLQQLFPGYAIANINYRLATSTDNHFPTQENDMKAALDYLAEQSGTYHISQNIILLGASAGAHMVLLQAYKNPSPRINTVIDFFGPVDMSTLYNYYPSASLAQLTFQTLMNGTPVSNTAIYNESSPLNYVSAQSPPTIIFHGIADNLVPISQSITLREKLNNFGVTNQLVSYPNVGHELWPSTIMKDVFSKVEIFVKANVH